MSVCVSRAFLPVVTVDSREVSENRGGMICNKGLLDGHEGGMLWLKYV